MVQIAKVFVEFDVIAEEIDKKQTIIFEVAKNPSLRVNK